MEYQKIKLGQSHDMTLVYFKIKLLLLVYV